MDPDEKQERNQFEELIQGLIDNQYGCCNDFLLPNDVLGLLDNIEALSKLGEMKESGIGNKSNFLQEKNIRGDKINWIDEKSINQFEMVYLKKIQKFILYLNKTCFTSIIQFESHYASYGKGSYYKRHQDQFKNEKGRKYSMVLYLNQNWNEEEDGGHLLLYPKNKEQKNIAPLGGRMVFFRSDEMEHEVQSSDTRERTSIAGWLKD